MEWNIEDKAASLCVLLEMAAELKPEEIFRCIVWLRYEFPDRLGDENSRLTEDQRLEFIRSLRACLARFGM